MPTTVIDLTKTTESESKKKIEFTFYIDGYGKMQLNNDAPHKPEDFNFIELISRKYTFNSNFDVMFAYNHQENRGSGIVFLGYFNDGVV